MGFFVIFLGVILTIFATAVLAYISIATMVGPWIAPTLVLIARLIRSITPSSKGSLAQLQDIITIQSIAAGGGSIAVGIGFTLPILYFLDAHTFHDLLRSPLSFCSLICMITLSAGCLGIFLGKIFSDRLRKQKLPFPVSQLTYKTATAQSQQGSLFFTGSLVTLIISALRDGIRSLPGILPKNIYFMPTLFGTELVFSLWPTLWAIGYTIGIKIAIPLLIGVLSKYIVLYPLNYHSLYLPVQLFTPFNYINFGTAFCSGLVLAEIVLGLLKNPSFMLKKVLGYLQSGNLALASRQTGTPFEAPSLLSIIEPVAATISFGALFSYLGFSVIAQIALLLFIVVATYEISIIGCEIGLVQFGRFSAFVLIPMMLLFKLNFVQITAICVFFNICAATASDILFDYQTGQFCQIPKKTTHLAQWIGLLTTSLSIGCILYLLFTQLQLGSADLFAHRGQSKALLIKSFDFNPLIVSFGFLYGIFLKKCRISPTMALGGIIMPNNITFGLVIGGIINFFVQRKNKQYLPFCSGIFASESLWIIITLCLKII